MVALLSFRVEIAPDLDILWDEEYRPKLLFILEDDEHHRFTRAGGPEHWDYADIAIGQLVDFLFDKKARKSAGGSFTCEFSRPCPGRVRMRVSYRERPIAEREYEEDVCHAAIRLCGHAKTFGALCEAVVKERGRSFRDELDAFIKEASTAPVQTRTRHAVARVESKTPRFVHETGFADRARRSVRSPTTDGAVRHEPPRVTQVAVSPVLKPSPKVQKGPLRSMQVRLFAMNLAKGEALPPTLPPEAKAQVVAYAKSVGLAVSDVI